MFPGALVRPRHWVTNGPRPRCRSRQRRWQLRRPPPGSNGSWSMETLIPTLALFSAYASCRAKTLAGYDGTSRFPSSELQRSTSAGIWGSPSLTSALGRAKTLTLHRQWWTILRRQWRLLGGPMWGQTVVPDGEAEPHRLCLPSSLRQRMQTLNTYSRVSAFFCAAK